MKLTILVVGKMRGLLEPAVHEFETRAAKYWKLDIVEVDAGLGRGGAHDPREVQRAEGERLIQRIPEGSDTWALTRLGTPMSSSELAALLGARMVQGSGDLAFLIGGAHGLDSETLRKATRSLSLSVMTLPHEMARLVLAEQLYRAGTILRNEPYHKGGR
jgi:23S rRNA (pseudouridine1915-N3)-methyltransferase